MQIRGLRLPERQRRRDHGSLQRDPGHPAPHPTRHVRISGGKQGAAGSVRPQTAVRQANRRRTRLDRRHFRRHELDSGEAAAARDEVSLCP